MDISQMQGGEAPNLSGIAGNTGNADLGKDEFLKLLVAQLQNQDPVNPQDGAEFAAQLAQFNSVEQLINVNDGLENLSEQQSSMSEGVTNTLAATLAGREVTAHANEFTIDEDVSEVPIHYKLDQAMDGGDMIIKNDDGDVVRTMDLGMVTAGDHKITWDGLDNQGNHVEPGTYSVEIQPDGDQDVTPITLMKGEAESVRYTGSGVELMVNGIAIPLADVEEIGKES